MLEYRLLSVVISRLVYVRIGAESGDMEMKHLGLLRGIRRT